MKNNLLKFFLFILLFSITTGLKGQIDSKYLAGAVPEKGGKVVFSDSVLVTSNSADQLYEKILMWAEANYNTGKSRIAYTSKEQRIISCRGESELVFSSSVLSLDQSMMNYQLNIFCFDGYYKTEIKSIYYLYNVANKKEPEKYTAEEWITDKEAVDKNKLYKSNGKFRIKTIDLVEDINNSIAITVNTNEIDLYYDKSTAKSYARKATAITAATATTTSQQQVAVQRVEEKQSGTTSELPPYKKLDPEKIPGNIIKMLKNDWMLITAGNDFKFNMMTASWGGLGFLWDKPVAFCFINPARYTFQLMESNDTYTLSFYTEAYRDALQYCGSNSGRDADKIKGSGLTPITLPSGCKAFGEAWMIIECKKLLTQQIKAEDVSDPKVVAQWSQSQFHKMYVGEILNVWVK